MKTGNSLPYLFTEFVNGSFSSDEDVIAWPIKLVSDTAVQQCDENDPELYGWGIYIGLAGDRVHIADVIDKEQARWLVLYLSGERRIKRGGLAALRTVYEILGDYTSSDVNLDVARDTARDALRTAGEEL